jgi:hypothetical protein
MLMDAGFVLSLLNLLIATARLALDVVVLAITPRKRKRPRHMRPPPDS